jgi:hypothetical protein
MKLAHEFTFKIEFFSSQAGVKFCIRPWVGKAESDPFYNILSEMTKAIEEFKKWHEEACQQKEFKNVSMHTNVAAFFCNQLGKRIIALENFDACETTCVFTTMQDNFIVENPGICLYKNWPN